MQLLSNKQSVDFGSAEVDAQEGFSGYLEKESTPEVYRQK